MEAARDDLAKGWCPSAHRPMQSGDGFILRVKPRLGRLSADEMRMICNTASTYGSGVIDLTNRANLQIRGLTETSAQSALSDLIAAGLVDADPDMDRKRAIITNPFGPSEGISHAYHILCETLLDVPPLSAKFGFAIDDYDAPVLHSASADIRLYVKDKSVLVHADGAEMGVTCTPDQLGSVIADLIAWFLSHDGLTLKRMRRVVAASPLPHKFASTPIPPMAQHPVIDHQIGARFGQFQAQDMRGLLEAYSGSFRVTPWRWMILDHPLQTKQIDGFATHPNDPLMHITACPGAPMCTSATVDTHAFASTLTDHLKGQVHVSGCAKGCAHPRRAEYTFVGRDGKFDLVRNGCSWETPSQTDIRLADLNMMDQ